MFDDDNLRHRVMKITGWYFGCEPFRTLLTESDHGTHLSCNSVRFDP